MSFSHRGSPQLVMMQEGESLLVPIEPWPQREPVCQAHSPGFGAGWSERLPPLITTALGASSLSLRCRDQAACNTRRRSRSMLARPYIWRLSSLSLVICPSTCPVLQGSVRAACTAGNSLDPEQSAAVPHRESLWLSPARGAVPRFDAHGSGAQSPGRARRETKGMGTDQTMLADRPHPWQSVPLACATTAISRGLGVRGAGAPLRAEAATEEKEDVGVIPAGRGQLRTKVHTLL
jgi:hypothetical protein